MPFAGGMVGFLNGNVAGLKVAAGQVTTASAVDTIATGLTTVIAAVANFEADVSDGNFLCQAEVGDQSSAPVAGSILIKTWKNTSGSDPTPLAATSFSQKVNYIAIGL